MKINDVNACAISGLHPEGVESAQSSASSKRQDARGGGDHVQLSSLSSLLTNLLASGDPHRTERLDRLATEVKTGKYQPDALAVGRSLVQESMARSV